MATSSSTTQPQSPLKRYLLVALVSTTIAYATIVSIKERRGTQGKHLREQRERHLMEDYELTKPTFYIPVGSQQDISLLQRYLCGAEGNSDSPPHLTGSRRLSNLSSFLSSDQLVYLGLSCHAVSENKDEKSKNKGLFHINDGIRRSFLNRLQRLQESSVDRHHDIIMVDPILSSYDSASASVLSDALLQTLNGLLSPSYNVKVIVLHQVFHEWLLKSFEGVLDWNNDSHAQRLYEAVQHQGYRHPAQKVHDRYSRYFGRRNVQWAQFKHGSNNRQQRVEDSLTSSLSVLELLFCDSIESAQDTCGLIRSSIDQIQHDEKANKKKNQEQEHHELRHRSSSNASHQDNEHSPEEENYDEEMQLGDLLYGSGLGQPSAATIGAFAEDTVSTIVVCPSQEALERLYHVSELVDRNARQASGEAWSAAFQEVHKKSFQKLILEHRFCQRVGNA